MKPLLSVDQMILADQATMTFLKCGSFELMQRVAGEMAENLFQLPGDFLFLCGPGNNGGDAYLTAEYLRKAGRQVWIHEVLSPESSDCKRAAKFCKAKRITEWPRHVNIVDGIFGVNGRSNLESGVKTILREANRKKSLRIALDIPSGMDCRLMRRHPETFYADQTLTVAFPKKAFLNPDCLEVLGEIKIIGSFFKAPIDISSDLLMIEDSDFHNPRFSRLTYKSERGRVAIVAGSQASPGASWLAAEAAARVGAGYVSLYFSDHLPRKFQIRDASFLLKWRWSSKDLNAESALLAGPGGFKKGRETLKFRGPAVLDADAIPFWKMRPKKEFTLLTPHPGEAGRLLKISSQEIVKDPLGALQSLWELTNQSIYLKTCPAYLSLQDEFNPESDEDFKKSKKSIKASQAGNRSVHNPSQASYVNLSATHVLGRAGSGDILSGMMAGYLVQNLKSPKQAVISSIVLQRRIAKLLNSKADAWIFDQLETMGAAIESLVKNKP